MQALVYTGPLTLELQDVPEPEPQPGEVVVDVGAVGICGSELEGFRSQSPFRVPPLIMGHELAGLRQDDGALVAVNPLLACGRCDLCLRGRRNICRRRALVGISRSGGFAERVAVPESACVTLPDGMTAERAALAEPLANAVHAWRLALGQDQSPARVGIIGAGMLGLAVALVVRRAGIADVMISDVNADRLASAERAGAGTAATALEGEFDVVFDAVGSAATRAASVDRLRPGGTAVWIGLHGPEAGFDGQALIRSEKRIVATFAYLERDFAAAVDLAAGLEDTSWVTSRPLAEGVETFLGLLEAPGAAAKTLLIPSIRWPQRGQAVRGLDAAPSRS
jgi:threonine dehydrogenase-like Zn-dependent dehydrogenase